MLLLKVNEATLLFEGDDLGRWIQRQTRDWFQLSEEQQQRLSALGGWSLTGVPQLATA
ncbi:helicase associated domain-containing protein [Streptomyces iakyrus]|uniref:helicase associated domain-containing protein n=1 Tax=Streptomyces iakyrus TaxID=68219 RepID=UPI0036E2EE09